MGSRLLRYHLCDCIFEGFFSSEQDSPLSSTPLQAEHRSGDKAEDENSSAARFSVWHLSHPFLLTGTGVRFNADLTGVLVCVCA